MICEYPAVSSEREPMQYSRLVVPSMQLAHRRPTPRCQSPEGHRHHRLHRQELHQQKDDGHRIIHDGPGSMELLYHIYKTS